MRTAWRSAVPFVVGALLPWQTVLILEKQNEFAVVQLFAWQVALFLWWWGRGRPKGWELAALWGALSAPALFLANASGALWQAFVLLMGGMLYATVSTLQEQESMWWQRGVAGGFVPVAALAFWQVGVGFVPASTLLGLAERNADRLGESVILVHGERILRAYGTFAHPNILAAWSVVMVVLGLQTKEWWGKWTALMGGVVTLLTCSRAGILALALVALWFWCRRAQSPMLLWRVSVVSVLALWGALVLAPGVLMALRGGGALEERSIMERQAQTQDAFTLLAQPRIALLGTGVGQSTLAQERQNPGQPSYAYQPVHNTALIVLIELGIPLAMVLSVFLWQERVRIPPTIAVLAPFLAVDHLLWTSAVGPLIIGLLSTLDDRLLSGKIIEQ